MTITKYLRAAGIPRYSPRPAETGKSHDLKAHLEARMKTGVWNPRVLLWELRE
jgi:hypothetical protein